MAGIRTFVGVALESAAAAALDRQLSPLRSLRANVRWTPIDRVHCTLTFLGDIEARRLPAILDVVTDAAAKHPPFDIELVGLGGFPSLARASTLWIGVAEGCKPLCSLANELANCLEPLGFPPERRPFKPHFTIGRLNRFQRADESQVARWTAMADTVFADFDVDSIRVYRSDLDRRGPTYSVMATCPLMGDRK